MNYIKKIKKLIINKKEKKRFEQLIEEEKSEIKYSKNMELDNDHYFQDLEYVNYDPSLKKFLERYSDLKIERIQFKPNIKEHKNRKQIFVEISEKINKIKNKYEKNMNGN